MKICFKCGEKKPLKEFYKHSGMKDGHLNKCKECTKKDSIIHRNINIDYYIQYDKERSMLSHRILGRKIYQKTESGKESKKKSLDKYRKSEKYRKFIKEYRNRNRLQLNARAKVHYAISVGKIKKMQCKICSKRKNVQAHHHDYSKPLDIIWLCIKCHNNIHHN